MWHEYHARHQSDGRAPAKRLSVQPSPGRNLAGPHEPERDRRSAKLGDAAERQGCAQAGEEAIHLRRLAGNVSEHGTARAAATGQYAVPAARSPHKSAPMPIAAIPTAIVTRGPTARMIGPFSCETAIAMR